MEPGFRAEFFTSMPSLLCLRAAAERAAWVKYSQ